MPEREELIAAFMAAGGDRAVLDDPATPHLLVVGSGIAGSRAVPGLEVEADDTGDGVSISVRVAAGVRLEKPLHTCFGVLHPSGDQRIGIDMVLEPGASADVIAHCVFPRAERVRHAMDARVTVGDGAAMAYHERHYHGPHGGIDVVPRARVTVGERGSYRSDFTLTDGMVGRLAIDYDVRADRQAVAELTARVFGHGRDRIRIRERVILAGEEARSLIRTRIAVEHDALAEVTGITEGHAAGARGHLDCMEIIRDRAVARAVPVIRVTHAQAKITHEAAIGSVDRQQLETLMAHGLDPEEAVAVIVRGMLG